MCACPWLWVRLDAMGERYLRDVLDSCTGTITHTPMMVYDVHNQAHVQRGRDAGNEKATSSLWAAASTKRKIQLQFR
jgi:hypothetical protein